jgi:hypothetical protein
MLPVGREDNEISKPVRVFIAFPIELQAIIKQTGNRTTENCSALRGYNLN